MKTIRICISIITLICNFTVTTQAQNTCKDVLYEADKLYQNGKVSEAVDKLLPCIGKGLNTEEQFEAYRLLGISYQFLGDKEKSELYIRKMLNLHPDYLDYPNIDPADFTQLLNKFEVLPLLKVGFNAGFNRTAGNLVKSYSVYNSPQTYLASTGYQFGGFAEYFVLPKVFLSADVMFNGLFIRQNIDDAGGWTQTYQESQQYLMFALNGNYEYPITKKWSVNAGAGAGINYLLSSHVYFETQNKTTESILQASKDAIEERNRNQYFANVKLGVSYTTGRGTFGFNMNYLHFLQNTVKDDMRMSDQNFIFNNQYVNDDISLRVLMFNFSYKMTLLRSIKLKN